MDTTQADFIRTVFKVYKLCVDPTAGVVALYGSHPLVGEWRKGEALILQYIGMSEWQTETLLPKNTTLSYKLLVVHPRTRHMIQEELFTRHLDITDTPLLVDLTFDGLVCKTRPMKCSLTRSGSPIALRVPTSGLKQQIGEPKLDTDFLMRDPQESWRFENSASASHSELAAALGRPDALYDRHQASRVADRLRDADVQTDLHGYMIGQPGSMTSVDVSTNTDIKLHASVSLGAKPGESFPYRGRTLEYMKKRVIADYHLPTPPTNQKSSVNSNQHVVKSSKSDVKNNRHDVKSSKSDVKNNKNDVKNNKNDVKTNENDVKSDENNVKNNENDVESDENDVKSDENDVKSDENDVKSDENDVKSDENDVNNCNSCYNQHDVNNNKHDVSNNQHDVSNNLHDVNNNLHDVNNNRNCWSFSQVFRSPYPV